jgi:hypothetical protein
MLCEEFRRVPWVTIHVCLFFTLSDFSTAMYLPFIEVGEPIMGRGTSYSPNRTY